MKYHGYKDKDGRLFIADKEGKVRIALGPDGGDALREYLSHERNGSHFVIYSKVEETEVKSTCENRENIIASTLEHSFRQGEFAAFRVLLGNMSGEDCRREAIDAMMDENIEENKQNTRNMLALYHCLIDAD